MTTVKVLSESGLELFSGVCERVEVSRSNATTATDVLVFKTASRPIHISGFRLIVVETPSDTTPGDTGITGVYSGRRR